MHLPKWMPSSEIKEVQPANIELILGAAVVSSIVRSIEAKLLHSANIELISVVKDVSSPDKSTEDKLVQSLNKYGQEVQALTPGSITTFLISAISCCQGASHRCV